MGSKVRIAAVGGSVWLGCARVERSLLDGVRQRRGATMARETVLRMITEGIEELNTDELTLVLMFIGKINGEGREEYGPLDLDDDRDYVSDALDESLDATFYALGALVRASRGKK